MSRNSENHATPNFRSACLAALAAATLTACGESSAPTASTAELLPDTPAETSALPRTVYVSGINSIAAFKTDEDGSVSHLPGSPFGAPASMPFAEGATLTPDGRYLYGFSAMAGLINVYEVRPDGGLAPLPEVKPDGDIFDIGLVSGGGNAYTGTVTPDGRFLYTTTWVENQVLAYKIASDGTLSPVAGSPFLTNESLIPNLGIIPESGLSTWPSMGVSPDGRHLYVSSAGTGVVHSFSIEPDGKLNKVDGSPFRGHFGFTDMVITPNGRYMYASDYVTFQMRGYSLDSNGAVTPLPGATIGSQGFGSQVLAISPDGCHLYVASVFGPNVAGYNIGEDGSLTLVPGSPFYPKALGPVGLQVTPDGRHLYVSSQSTVVLPQPMSIFAIASDGSLTEISDSPVNTGVAFPDFQSVAITPNQGPVASLKMSRSGNGFAFDASASSDPDGHVTSFKWDFGDGQSQVGGAKLTHSFPRSGTYDVTVTAIDNEGCSDEFIYTGKITLCNTGERARATLQVRVGG